MIYTGYLGLLPMLGLYTLFIVSGLVQTPASVNKTSLASTTRGNMVLWKDYRF